MDHANSILLLHPPSYDPSPFLGRLTKSSENPASKAQHAPNPTSTAETSISYPWRIDNKYYTADVDFVPVPLSKDVEQVLSTAMYKKIGVVLYAFEGKLPRTVSPAIIKLLSEPRDIALAIRARSTANDHEGTETEAEEEADNDAADGDTEEVREMFEEVGMEFVDELHPLTEEDDERPLEPLDSVRQTLMTHLWPNMLRKPLPRSTHFPLVTEPNEDEDDDGSTAASPQSSGSTSPTTAFPVQFRRPPPLSAEVAGAPRPAGGVGGQDTTGFPGLEELRAQILAGEFQNIDRIDRLDDDAAYELESGEEGSGGDDGFGPAAEEYARLDDWLDEDDEEFQPAELRDDEPTDVEPDETDGKGEGGKVDWLEQNDGQVKVDPSPSARQGLAQNVEEGDWLDADDEAYDPISSDVPRSTSGQTGPTGPKTDTRTKEAKSAAENEGFEDDFADFQSYSAPSSSSTTVTRAKSNNDMDSEESLAMDPTPLLMHLQSVRAELAGVEDEDERRVRAGREVQQLMRSLGMDMGADEFDGLDI